MADIGEHVLVIRTAITDLMHKKYYYEQLFSNTANDQKAKQLEEMKALAKTIQGAADRIMFEVTILEEKFKKYG